jgi:mono/diheme cytochrome c family protein/glucose/arabinose dehydrogenase
MLDKNPLHLIAFISLVLASPLSAAPFDQRLYNQKGRTYSPKESMALIEMQEGYSLELVAAEPMVEEPAAIAWDGDGKLYVAELNTYMQDIDGKNQHSPVCRVILLEDTDDDGKMDKRSVFVDKLVLPRMIQPIDDRVIIRETNTFDLHSYRDTDGDGIADEKNLVFKGGSRGGNLEHQPSGLDWNIDNWMYVTYTNKRYRWKNDHIIAEQLPFGSGQWGVTHDDVGRNFFCTGGGENPAMDFQRPMIYGKISLPGEKENGFRTVFPLVEIPDVQGGHGRYRKSNLTLNNFTGCAGQHIFRGDRLPKEMYGNYFIPEPVGRLVRRARVVNNNGKIIVKNANPGTEFMRSRDANFRPVNAGTGPDGCLYICDMYRGIIQEGNWVRPGSYLRGVVENYGLNKNIKRGRIYRVVHESTKRGKKPQMLNAKTEELVAHLSHPNGWWRDTAQKLIVVRKDKSAALKLRSNVMEPKSSVSSLGRLHSLWALEGLELLDNELLIKAMKDPDQRVRSAAIRLCEEKLINGDTELIPEISKMKSNPEIEIAIQIVLTLVRTGAEGGAAIIEEVVSLNKENETLKAITGNYMAKIKEAKLKSTETKFIALGRTNYQTICMNCHGSDGKGTPVAGTEMTLGAPLPRSPRVHGRKDIPIKIMLKGMIGDLDGRKFPGPMLPLESYDDEWIAATLTYIRNSWGNNSELISTQEVAAVRAQIKDRKEMWKSSEIITMAPVPLIEMRKWKFTASHRQEGCNNAIDGNIKTRWETGISQTPGMWFAFDMGNERKINTLVLDSSGSAEDYPRYYSIETSKNGKDWGESIITGKGQHPITEIVLPPTTARHIRVTQRGTSNGKFWSIHRLEVYAN